MGILANRPSSETNLNFLDLDDDAIRHLRGNFKNYFQVIRTKTSDNVLSFWSFTNNKP